MNILYVGHTYTIRANQAKIVALARQPGVEITLVTPQGWRGPLYNNKTDTFDRAEAPNVTHRIIPAFLLGKEGAYFYNPSIFSLIATLKPDIVHVEQGAYAVSFTQILLAVKLFSRRSKALFFTWWNLPYRPRGIKRILESFNLKNSDAAIAGNSAAKEILKEHGFQKPISILPQLGVDVSVYQPISNFSAERPFTIGYAGRITTEKGVLDLVRASAQLSRTNEVSLYFVGGGEALEDAKREAAHYGVPLRHSEAVRNEQLVPHFDEMDVLVLPSRSTPEWVEQFGHILIEAMACGVPVVGSSSGEIPNVIGDAGLIFEEGNIDDLALKLGSLIDTRERVRLRAAGLERVKKHFTHEKIAEAQVRIYRELLGLQRESVSDYIDSAIRQTEVHSA